MTRRHPDKNVENAEEASQQFTRISAAYQRLCSPSADQEYEDCTVSQLFTEAFFEECERRQLTPMSILQL